MGERLLCKQEVIGSIPFTSTTGPSSPGEVGPPAAVAPHGAAKADRSGKHEFAGGRNAIGVFFDRVKRECDRDGCRRGTGAIAGSVWCLSLEVKSVFMGKDAALRGLSL